MLDPNAYTTRAALAGPCDFVKTLVDGAMEYSAPIVSLINSAPHEDLPLILATLHITADALKFQVKPDGYVDFLLDLLRRSSTSTVITARIPKEKEEPPDASV